MMPVRVPPARFVFRLLEGTMCLFLIKTGTRVHFEVRDGELVLTPLTPRYFEHMAGLLGTGGKALKVLLEDKKKEREL